jgi:hypothetical protein
MTIAEKMCSTNVILAATESIDATAIRSLKLCAPTTQPASPPLAEETSQLNAELIAEELLLHHLQSSTHLQLQSLTSHHLQSTHLQLQSTHLQLQSSTHLQLQSLTSHHLQLQSTHLQLQSTHLQLIFAKE